MLLDPSRKGQRIVTATMELHQPGVHSSRKPIRMPFAHHVQMTGQLKIPEVGDAIARADGIAVTRHDCHMPAGLQGLGKHDQRLCGTGQMLVDVSQNDDVEIALLSTAHLSSSETMRIPRPRAMAAAASLTSTPKHSNRSVQSLRILPVLHPKSSTRLPLAQLLESAAKQSIRGKAVALLKGFEIQVSIVLIELVNGQRARLEVEAAARAVPDRIGGMMEDFAGGHRIVGHGRLAHLRGLVTAATGANGRNITGPRFGSKSGTGVPSSSPGVRATTIGRSSTRHESAAIPRVTPSAKSVTIASEALAILGACPRKIACNSPEIG